MVHLSGRPGGTESERFMYVSIVVIVASGLWQEEEFGSCGSSENHSSRRPGSFVLGMCRSDLRSGENRCAWGC